MENLYKTFKTNKKLGIQQIADFFIHQYNVKTIKEAAPEMYYYDKGIYIRAEQKIETELSKLLEEDYSINHKREVINQIWSKSYTNRRDFIVDKWLINLNNGVFDLRTGLFTDHDYQNLFFTKIATDYDPNATCEKIDKFLMQLLPLEDVMIIKEWFGYCLFRDYFIKKALIMTGEKDTGKTTVIDLFVQLIGLENISGVSLQQMAGDKFSITDLYNRHVNIYDDMSAQDVKDGGRFKMVTGRSPISAEYKYGNRFNFYNFAKMTFACNRIPNVQDNDDDAYFKRWIIIKFLRVVTNPNKFLLESIATPDQLSGLLNSMLDNLNRILTNQKFTYIKNHEEIKAEMLRSGSVVASYAYDCVEESIGSWISKGDLHFYFTQYANLYNLPYVEIKKFGKELVKYARYATEGRHQNRKGWNNIKINEDFKQKFIDAGLAEDIQDVVQPIRPTEVEVLDEKNIRPVSRSQATCPADEKTEAKTDSEEDRLLRERFEEVV